MGRLTEREVIEAFKIDNALLGENESGIVERNNIAIKCIEELREYRSVCDSPDKLKLIDELYLERCEEINRLKAELEEYKKLEEEELLLKLPCKFGTKIYWLRPNAKGIPAEVMEHKFDCVMIDSIDLFGRVIFLTREEAKQALGRMKEVQDVN